MEVKRFSIQQGLDVDQNILGVPRIQNTLAFHTSRLTQFLQLAKQKSVLLARTANPLRIRPGDLFVAEVLPNLRENLS
jgi:hypothetical protein